MPTTRTTLHSCRLCKNKDDNYMVACDNCKKWFHYVCVNVGASVCDELWTCPICHPNFDDTHVSGASGVQTTVSTSTTFTAATTMSATPTTATYATTSTSTPISHSNFAEIDLRRKEIELETTKAQIKLLELQRELNQREDRPIVSIPAIVPVTNPVMTPTAVSSHLQPSTLASFLQGNTGVPSIPTIFGSVQSPTLSWASTTYALTSSTSRQSYANPSQGNPGSLNFPNFTTSPASAFASSSAQIPIMTTSVNPSVSSNSTINQWPSSIANHPNPSAASFYQPQTILTPIERIAVRQGFKMDLPSFSGKVNEWPIFLSQFEFTRELCSPIENILRLQKALKEDALALVKNLLLNPANVDQVMETLKLMYGRPDQLIRAQIDNLKKEADIIGLQRGKLQSVIQLSILVKNLCAAIDNAGLVEYYANPLMLHDMVNMLGDEMKFKWATYRSMVPSASVKEFSQWLDCLATNLCAVLPTITLSKQTTKSKDVKNLNLHTNPSSTSDSELPNEPEDPPCNAEKNKKTATKKTTGNTPKKVQDKCILCEESCDNITNCAKFVSSSPKERLKIRKDLNLCRCCLKKHRKHCSEAKACGVDGCTRLHHKMLHQPEKAESINNHFCHDETLLRYIPVMALNGDNSSEEVALFDDGSTVTLVEDSIEDQVGVIPGESQPLHLKWTGDVERSEESSKLVTLKIKGMDGSSQTFEIKARTVSSLNLAEQSLNYGTLAAKYQHLKGIPVHSYANAKPRILIGLDNWHLMLPLKVREGGRNEPKATKTRLGWSIGGVINSNVTDKVFVSTHAAACNCQLVADKKLEDLVRSFYSVDSMGILKRPEYALTQEERRAKSIMEATTEYREGRYQVGLLWKHNEIQLPDSKSMAMSRLRCLERKLSKDPQLKTTFQDLFNDYITKGYVRKLDQAEIRNESSRVWYLPMFAVVNPNKPGKVRPVWDAAAKVQNICLNDLLLKGEDLNCSLLSVLMRFREGQIALNADIQQMFHQVRVRDEDQSAQRFLWRNCEEEQAPTEYALTVLSFGSTSSPYQALYIMKKNAEKFKLQYPQAANSILGNHYMDDMLDSVSSEDEAKSLAVQVQEIHAAAGFNIRNWKSNSLSIASFMNGAVQGNELVQMISPDENIDKVLGMFWDSHADHFVYSLKYNKASIEVLDGSRVPTKREILRTLMSIYDPLGLIEHHKIGLKIILRDTWMYNLKWDQSIPDDLNLRWQDWRETLSDLQTLKIPRCYLKEGWKWEDCQTELHILVDASEQLYAACAYFRIDNPNGIHLVLLSGKSRSAPLKQISIPRLELQAAVIGARLEKTIMSSLRLQINRSVFWTDSSTVLCWLNSEKKLPAFVSFRIGEILESTNVHSWRYVPTKLNNADDVTKWKLPIDLSMNHRWFKGPEFLTDPEESWPTTPIKHIEKEALEILLNVHDLGEPPIVDCRRFSKWERLHRAIGWVLRFANMFSAKKEAKERPTGELTSEELTRAEVVLFKLAQKECYPQVLHLLKNNKVLTMKDPLYKVSPFLDTKGVIRVNGRIEHSTNADYDAKFPIILPRHHRITMLIVDSQHRRCFHQFDATVASEIHQRFYIPSLRRVVREVKVECKYCTVRNARPLPPMMSPLPEARLAEYCAPFTHTGVDLFGPLIVRIGRRNEKRWGVLFTCLTIRAIHIELAASLSTNSFLLCLRNFVNRRGEPRVLYSDHGTNLVGAERVMKELFDQIDFQEVERRTTTIATKWKRNPPTAAHMGGCWERYVQSVKSALKVIIPPNHTPSPEVLQSALIEIEAVINSKPLFYCSLDHEDQEPLTPRNFLMLSDKYVKPLGDPNPDAKVVKEQYKLSQVMAQRFYRHWIRYYRPTLLLRGKWHDDPPPLEKGDVVVIMDENDRSRRWPKGRILEIYKSRDGKVRSASVQTKDGTYHRPAVKLAKLDINRG